MTVQFPKLALGTWLIGGAGEPDPGNDDAKDIRVIKTALEAGVTLIDTAQNYAAGKCEALVGRAVAGVPRKDFQILTKQDKAHLTYDEVIKGCQDSMRRLGVDYIDYFVCHAPNPMVDMRDFFRAANRLHKDGLIRHVGVSNFGPNMLALALATSDVPIALDQVSFGVNDGNILTSGTYDFCVSHDIPIQAFRTLVDLDKTNDTGKLLLSLAQKYKLTFEQMALAYLNSYQGVCFTIRASTKQHWQDIQDSLAVTVAAEDIAALRQLQLSKQGGFGEFLYL